MYLLYVVSWTKPIFKAMKKDDIQKPTITYALVQLQGLLFLLNCTPRKTYISCPEKAHHVTKRHPNVDG